MRVLAGALVVFAMLLTGCSSYREPSIKLLNAATIEKTDEAISAQFVLELTNPNDEPLELVQFKYRLRVDGREVYQGIRAAQATLAAKATRTMTIPAVLRYDRLGWTESSGSSSASYEIKGTVQYITPGEIAQILFDTGVRKPKAGFSGSGELVLSGPTK